MAGEDLETWTLERQLSRPGAVTSCAWSPDGMRLVSVGGGRVGVWDVFTGREVGSNPDTPSPASTPLPTPFHRPPCPVPLPCPSLSLLRRTVY